MCQCGPNMPGLLPVDISRADLADLRRKLDSFGLNVASFNGDGDYMADDVDAEIAVTMERLKIAATLGSGVLIVFAGWQNKDDQAIYDQVSQAIKTVAQEAAQRGITVALENHGGLTGSIEQCNRILAGINESNVGLNYDPANFLMYDQNPLEALDRLEYPIVFTHLKSLKINSNGSKEYCRINDGVIDYRPIVKRLLVGYDGFYGLEYEEPADVFEGTLDDLKSLRNILDEIG